MRVNELTVLVEEKIKRQQLKQFLSDRGYQYQGEGFYAIVFTNRRGQLLKVYPMPTQGFDPMYFYRIARRMKGNPHVPQFGAWHKINVGGQDYLAIASEQLKSAPADPKLRQLASYIWEFVTPVDNETVEDAMLHRVARLEQMSQDPWILRTTDPRQRAAQEKRISKTIADGRRYLKLLTSNPEYSRELEGFHLAKLEVCRQGDCTDLRDENIMWRGNTPVINDPFSVTS